jgi:pilus assembly protein CpaD
MNVGEIYRGFSLKLVAGPVLAAVLLGGCLKEDRSWDYRANNPIVVKKETVSLVVSMAPGQYSLTGQDSARLNKYLRDYIRRGRGSLDVKVAPLPGGPDQTAVRTNQIKRLLRGAGMRSDEFRIIVSETSDPDGVFMSYGAHRASVPSCTNIAWGPTFDGSNYPVKSFGCAYQRAFGASIADPGDLVKARDTGPKPTFRDVEVMKNYRAGQPTGAVKSGDQSGIGFGNTTGGSGAEAQ